MARKVNRRDGRARWKNPRRDEGGHFLQSERRERNRGLIVLAVALLVAIIVTALVASRDDSPEIELIDVESGAAIGTLLTADTGEADDVPGDTVPATTVPATTVAEVAAPAEAAAVAGAPAVEEPVVDEAAGDETPAVFRPAAIFDPGFTNSVFPGSAEEIAAAVDAAEFAARYPIRVPAEGEVLSIYVGGDSLSDAPRVGLVRSDALFDLEIGTKISSGLVATWFFDWPAHLEESVLPAGHDVVVLTFGGNDAQPIGGDAEPGTDLWRERYAERVDRIAAMFAGEAQVIWVGLPLVEPRNIQRIVPVVNGVLEEAAERWAHFSYVDAVTMFSDAEGGYAQYLPDPDSGEMVQVRAPDGVHYTPMSGEWIADRVLAIIGERMSDPSRLWPPDTVVDEGPNEATESLDVDE